MFIVREMRVICAQVFILRRLEHGFHGFVPSPIAERVAEFAFHSGKGLQQELSEVAESGSVARRDAALGEGTKHLTERSLRSVAVVNLPEGVSSSTMAWLARDCLRDFFVFGAW